MEDHARILEERVEPLTVGRGQGEHHKGVVPRAEQEGEKRHDAQEEGEEPEPRPAGKLPVCAGEQEGRSADGDHERPEQERPCLPGPERSQAVEEGQRPFRIAGDVVKGKITPAKRADEYGGCGGQAEGDRSLDPLEAAQVGVFLLPERSQSDGASGERAKKRQGECGGCGKVHGRSVEARRRAGIRLWTRSVRGWIFRISTGTWS